MSPPLPLISDSSDAHPGQEPRGYSASPATLVQNIIGAVLVAVCLWLGSTVSGLEKSNAAREQSIKTQATATERLAKITDDLRNTVSDIRVEQANRAAMKDKVSALTVEIHNLRSRVRALEVGGK